MMDAKHGGIPMQCTNCHSKAEYSPLRLGKKCGQCKIGTWIPYKGEVNERPKREADKQGDSTEQT